MKKILGLCLTALFSSATIVASPLKADGGLKLNFITHDLVEEANPGGVSTMEVSTSENELILTSSSMSNGMYYSLQYDFDTSKTYFISGQFKTSSESGCQIWALPNYDSLKICDDSAEFTSFYTTFTPSKGTNQIGIQRAYPDNSSLATFTFKDLCIGECKDVTYGEQIGQLLDVPEKANYSAKWQIDNVDIASSTIYSWNENKFAKVVYSKENTSIFFKQHDLVSETNPNGASNVENINNVLTWTSTPSDVYYSLMYNFDSTKEYFISGEVKGSTSSSFHIWTLPDWGLIKESQEISISYGKFFYTFTPATSTNQLCLQRTAPSGGSVTFEIKNFCFGEIKSTKNGNAIGELPVIPEKNGYSSKWQINGEDISSSTIFSYTDDVYADVLYSKDKYILNFQQHDLVAETNLADVSTMSVSSSSEQLVLSSSADTQIYYSLNYAFNSNKTYYISGESKANAVADFHFWTLGNWGLIQEAYRATPSWKSFYFTFKPAENTNQLGIQRAYAEATNIELILRNFTFGECKEINKNAEIGNLPAIESLDDSTGYWTIDGSEISSSTIYSWEDDKYAKIIYKNDNKKVFFKEHDLVCEGNINGSSNMKVSVENDELVLTSSSGDNNSYYSYEYELEEGKAYFLSGSVKASKSTQLHFWALPDWTLVSESFAVGTDWGSFQLTFVAGEETNQLCIQRPLSSDTSEIEYRFKDFYFGECRKVKIGEEISTLSGLVSYKNGYDPIGWEIDGESISESTLFSYDNDVFADQTFVPNNYKIGLSALNYAQSIEGYKDNGKNIEFNSDGTTLTLNALEDGAAVFLPSLTLTKDHNYMISFDLKTEDDSEVAVGVDKLVEPEILDVVSSNGEFAHFSMTFITEFKVDSVEELSIYLQLPTSGKAYLKNILIADLDDPTSIDVTFNEVIGVKPESPYGYEGYWMLNDEEISENTVYSIPDSSIAYFVGTPKEFFVTFKVNPNDTTNIAFYRIKYGQKLSDVITSLPVVPAVDGKIGKWVLNNQDLDLNTVVNGNITILVQYEDIKVEESPAKKKKGCGGSILASSTILTLCSVLGAALLKKKRIK